MQWRLKSPASQLFTQPFIETQIKENIKVPRHWPLCGNSPVTGEFPAQMTSNAENISIWWRHHAHPHERTMGCLSWVIWSNITAKYRECTVLRISQRKRYRQKTLHCSMCCILKVLSRWYHRVIWQDCRRCTGPNRRLNSLRPRQNGRLFADDTFKRIFLNENIRISTKNSLKFVPKGLINNIPALVPIMAWRRPGDTDAYMRDSATMS